MFIAEMYASIVRPRRGRDENKKKSAKKRNRAKVRNPIDFTADTSAHVCGKICVREKIYLHQGENLSASGRKFICIREKIYLRQGENLSASGRKFSRTSGKK
jgi:hypothetical protein